MNDHAQKLMRSGNLLNLSSKLDNIDWTNITIWVLIVIFSPIIIVFMMLCWTVAFGYVMWCYLLSLWRGDEMR